MHCQSLSIALTGSGGSGVMTTGSLLLEAASQAGWYGFMGRSAGPVIPHCHTVNVKPFSHLSSVITATTLARVG